MTDSIVDLATVASDARNNRGNSKMIAKLRSPT